MDVHVIASTLLKGLRVMENTKLRDGFLNFDAQDSRILYQIVLVLKCVVVAFGVKKIPRTVTFLMLFADFIKSCIVEIGPRGILGPFSCFLLTSPVFLLFNDDARDVPLANAFVFAVASQCGSFEFFLDVYIVLLLFVSVFRLYGQEIDKAFVCLSFLLCLDWTTQYLLAGDKIGVMHAVLLVHAPAIFLTGVLLPSDPQSLRHFIFFVVGLTMWQLCSLAIAVFRKGVTSNRFYILDETWDWIKHPNEKLGEIFLFH